MPWPVRGTHLTFIGPNPMNNNILTQKIVTQTAISALIIVALTACSGGSRSSNPPDVSPSEPPETQEFIASEASFQKFTDWKITDYAVGATNPAIGSAHKAGDSNFARAVFENAEAQNHQSGEYPLGSIIVKETYSTLMGQKAHAEMGGVLAMAKRGGGFNPENAGWEWFMLTPEGDITARGANLGACGVCHAQATDDAGADYTFKKPSEYIATNDDFGNYKEWTLVEQATGNSASNAGAHSVTAIRRTYKKQALVSPYFEAGEYPVGTVIVKELMEADGSLGNIYGMVKRGGGFNPNDKGWEWFLLGQNSEVSRRSGSGGLAFCGTCHAQAGDPERVNQDASYQGRDFVFHKKDDPVPHPE